MAKIRLSSRHGMCFKNRSTLDVTILRSQGRTPFRATYHWALIGLSAIPGERKRRYAIFCDSAVGRAFARHLCRAKVRPTKHLSVHRELLMVCLYQGLDLGCLSFLIFAFCCCLSAFCFSPFCLSFLPPLSPIVTLLIQSVFLS